MARFHLAPAAEQDIEDILSWTHQQFGEHIRIRYEELLVQSILDLAADPERSGSYSRPEISKFARSYHLRNSRNHVNRSIGRIRQPRHFLIYRIGQDGDIDIARVLHDSMDLPRYLPDDEQSES